MQVPAKFAYERADSVPHALELLERYGPEARVVAGGHSLIPMMKLRLAQPEALIDINGLSEELGQIAVEGDELAIGALARHAELLAGTIATDLFPIFRDAERVIADPIVRNRGTVGGSLCQADPSEDLSAVFSALRASAVIRGRRGSAVAGRRSDENAATVATTGGDGFPGDRTRRTQGGHENSGTRTVPIPSSTSARTRPRSSRASCSSSSGCRSGRAPAART
nr:FAD binding domain-containing protein [Nonomuraea terrae]